MASSRIKVVAPAKINLFLEVLGRREDGYHEVRTVLQTIDLLDRLEFSLEGGTRGFTMELDPAVPGIPVGGGNLCLRAFERYREAAGRDLAGGVHLRLSKRIPAAAGLGGGSSDAAATLMALNELNERGLGAEELADVAAGLGSDVPFFLSGGTSLAEGRGELVRALTPAAPLRVVLAKPAGGLSAREVYEAWDGEASRQAVRAEMSDWAQALAGETPAQLEALMFNNLERPALGLEPQASRLIAAAHDLGAKAMVSGSGPTVFALVGNTANAERLAQAWVSLAEEVFITRFRPRGCEVVT